MSRTEFMEELRKLLWGMSVEEQKEALQYYEAYFDDAGPENEASVIKELESPQKVAAVIKAGLAGGDDESAEYRETGYRDTRFEDTQAPATREELRQADREKREEEAAGKSADTGYHYGGQTAGADHRPGGQSADAGYHYGGRTADNGYRQGGENTGTGYQHGGQTEDAAYHYTGRSAYGQGGAGNTSGKPWTSRGLKAVLIILILVIGIPTVVPVAGGLLVALLVILVVIAVLLAIFPIIGICAIVAGVVLVVSGIEAALHLALPEALFLVGGGFLAMAFGIVFTAFCLWVCVKFIPPMFRWFVDLCRRGINRLRGRQV